MATRKLEVMIVGDERGLSRALDRSQKKTSRFAGVAKKAMAGVGIAAGGAAIGVKRFTDAAGEAEKSQARLKAQLNASGISFKKHGGEIERVIQKTSKLAALDDEDLQDAFTNIVRTTGSVNRSLRLTGLAADFARGKQIEVAKAGEIVAKVAGGNVGILSRYGVTIEKGATASEALGALQQKFAGQAETYGKTNAAAQDRIRVSVENMEEAIGAKLAPAFAAVTAYINRFIDGMVKGTGAGGRFRDTMVGVAGNLQAIARQAAPVLAPLGSLAATLVQSKAAMTAVAVVAGGLVVRIVALKVAAVVAAAMAALTKALAFAKVALLALRAPLLAITLLMNANPISAVVIAIAALGAALVVAYKKSDTFRRAVDGAFRVLKTAVLTWFNSGKTYFGAWVRVFQTVVGAVRTGVATMLRIFDKWLGGFSSILTAAGRIPGIGAKFRAAARGIDEAREKLRGTADAIDGVRKRKDTSVRVRVGISWPKGIRGALPGLGGVKGGDGWGLSNAINDVVRRGAQAQLNKIPFDRMAGGLGLGGGRVSGTGLNAFNKLAARFGVQVGSGFRPGSITSSGNLSYHAMGRARDFPGPPGKMMAFAQFLAARFGARLKELIYTPLGFSIKDGRRVPPYAQSQHLDHVHVAMQRGGTLPGSGNGDKVPVLAEPGEGFINKRAVRALGGRAAIDAINRVVPRFQKGGVIGRFSSTSYGPPWNAMNGTGVTATGVNLRPAKKAYGVAVDPRRIKLGSKVWAWPNPFGYRGPFKAFDTGGAIKGDRVDFYDWRGRGKQMGWGSRATTLYRANPFGKNGAKKGRAKPDNRIFTFGGGKLRRHRPSTLVAEEFGKGRPFTSPIKPRVITPGEAGGSLTGDVGGSDGPSGPTPAEQLAEQMKELAEQVAGLKAETAERNRITSSTLAIGLREAERALADMIAGQLGTKVALRAATPGTGKLANY